MQKFNLNTLESANMTVASEEVLNEVNGGHTMKYVRTVQNSCGGSWEYWEVSANGCTDGCPLAAAKHVRKYYAKKVKTFKLSRDEGSVSGWNVRWGDGCIVKVSNNTSNGSWFTYYSWY